MRTHAVMTKEAARPGLAPPLRTPALRSILLGAGAQPKLRVGAVDDPAEAEADRTADRIMRMPDQRGILRRKCALCDEEEKMRRKETRGASHAGGPLSPAAEAAVSSLGPGAPLPASERAFFEPRFGHSLGRVHVHDGAQAAQAASAVNARAFALGSSVAFARGEYQPGTRGGRELLAHELAHVGQSPKDGDPPAIRRAMKFEFQVKQNFINGWDGTDLWTLPRKFGPQDYIVKDKSDARLESETAGQIEFESEWEREWPKLKAQITAMQQMIADMKAAKDVTIGAVKYKAFPFNIDHLREGGWKGKKGKKFENNSKEGHLDKALEAGHELLVRQGDPSWKAYIQTSESFSASQYESFLIDYENRWYDPSSLGKDKKKQSKPREKAPFNIVVKVIVLADGLMPQINKAKLADSEIASLHGFIEMIIDYIIRGQFPAFSPIGAPGKFSFALMNRTHFGSIHVHLLSKGEKAAFKRFVNNAQKLFLDDLGIKSTDRFFKYGHGAGKKSPNPRINEWLAGIIAGADLISALDTTGPISGSMGKFKAGEEKGKNKGLVRFEVRNTAGNEAKVWDWVTYAKDRFDGAVTNRQRSDDTQLLSASP